MIKFLIPKNNEHQFKDAFRGSIVDAVAKVLGADVVRLLSGRPMIVRGGQEIDITMCRIEDLVAVYESLPAKEQRACGFSVVHLPELPELKDVGGAKLKYTTRWLNSAPGVTARTEIVIERMVVRTNLPR